MFGQALGVPSTARPPLPHPPDERVSFLPVQRQSLNLNLNPVPQPAGQSRDPNAPPQAQPPTHIPVMPRGDSGTQRRNSASNKMRPFGCHNNHAGYEAEPQAKPQAIGRGDGDGEGDGEEEIPASDIELANGQTLPTRWKNGRLQLMIPREMRTLSEIPLANGICIRVRRKPAHPPTHPQVKPPQLTRARVQRTATRP